MSTWIKLDRKIRKHWIADNETHFRRWIFLLMEVNYAESKFPLGNSLHTIPKGGSAKSLDKWSAIFGCGKKSTVNFFNMLESDNMITRETIGKGKCSTTLIVVGNYEEYQVVGQRKAPRKQPREGSRKGSTEKEIKEMKEIIYAPEVQNLYNWINDKCPRVQKMEDPITLQEADILLKDYNSKTIAKNFQAMHNWKPLLTKNSSANLTYRNWAGPKDKNPDSSKIDINNF